MRTNFITILLFLSVITQSTLSKSPHEGQNRRILHQPLFPATSDPPPPPPPPPQPPSGPDTLNPDQPFLHVPATPGQAQQPPPGGTTPLANSAATRAPNLAGKVAIAVSSGVLALALLSALAFYLHRRRRSENQDESQKPLGPHSLTAGQESRAPPPAFLFMESVEPSAPTVARERNAGNGSPYRKLNPGKRSERYRPSPELQPLPPLPKPAAATSSPPPMSSTSSDDESHDNNFHTPQGSIISNESPGSRYTCANNPISTRPENHSRPPYSKRTSTKSRLSAPSPDTKPVIIPSIKQPPPSVGPLPQSKMLAYTPKGPKFVGPPAPLDMASLQSITIEDKPAIKIPIPPPPPAVVAAQPSVPRKFRYVESNTPSPVSKNVTRQDSSSPSSKASSGAGNTVIPGHGDTNKAVNSSEKNDKDDRDGTRPKLKPLHWDKVRATSERATVWDQLKSSSFQLNEDAMESLFGCNSITSVPNEPANRRQSALPDLEQENRVLDPKKSQNIAILIRALNVTREEVSEALLDGNPEGLGPELLEALSKMAPTKEEEIKLKDYNGEVSKLGSAERFLKGILDIPFAFKRVEAMLYRANFHAEVLYLKKSFQTLEEASEELKKSRLFLKLLEAVLRTGNRMNDGTNRGDARAFKLDTLLKLADVKGADGKTTLLHFVVQEIIRSEGPNLDPKKTDYEFKEEEFRKQGLQLVVRLGEELGSVKKAAGMDSGVLSGYVMKLEAGLDKVRSMMQREKQGLLLQGKFFSSMNEFLEEAGGEISRIKAEEGKALSQVKEVTEYFHGDAAKEEAHPLRIFMVVRDFLGILDKVCKDVGRIPAMATVGAGRSFRMLENSSRTRFIADFADG